MAIPIRPWPPPASLRLTNTATPDVARGPGGGPQRGDQLRPPVVDDHAAAVLPLELRAAVPVHQHRVPRRRRAQDGELGGVRGVADGVPLEQLLDAGRDVVGPVLALDGGRAGRQDLPFACGGGAGGGRGRTSQGPSSCHRWGRGSGNGGWHFRIPSI